MTIKIFSRAIAELILEKPAEAEKVLERAKKLISGKYQSISWKKLNNAIINIIAKQKGITRYKITTTNSLTNSQKEALSKKLSEKSDITYKTDSRILGGLIIKTEDRELDNSLRTKIQSYKKSINTINNAQLNK